MVFVVLAGSLTFTVVSFEMSTIVRPSSLTPDKLEAETAIRARACSENLAIERRASQELLVLAVGSVWSVSCRLSVSAEPVSYSWWRLLRTKELPLSTSESPPPATIEAPVTVRVPLL
jgi:hypothetical protein